MSRSYTGPLRADKEVLPKHIQIGEPIWEKRNNGKWYTVEGQEVEVEEMSLEELIRRVTGNV